MAKLILKTDELTLGRGIYMNILLHPIWAAPFPGRRIVVESEIPLWSEASDGAMAHLLGYHVDMATLAQ